MMRYKLIKKEVKKMISIAILDDCEHDRELLKYITHHYLKNKKVEYEISVYENSFNLSMDLKENKYYDIFLLDVEMPERSGLQVAKEIRKYYLEPYIIYVTNYVEFAIEAFEVNAFRYIPKIMIEDKLPQAYDALVPKIENIDQRSYIVGKDNGLERILYRDIFFIQKEGKYITIYHRNGSSKERKALKDIYEELNSNEFFYIDKSYIANVKHILSCHKGNVVMRNNMALPVSRPRYNAVKEKIMEFWKEYQ